MIAVLWDLLFGALGAVTLLVIVIGVSPIRSALSKLASGFIDHQFNARIEVLKSELRRSEERLSAELRVAEQHTKMLAENVLSLRSSRLGVLDSRRMQAIEKVWAAKTAIDAWKLAPLLLSQIRLDEVLKSAEAGDARVEQFAASLDRMTGIDFKKDASSISAVSERPFLPANVWTLFSAYQSVMTHAVVILKGLQVGGGRYIKKEDTLKPLMLLALPEYKDYIEKFGLSGYYHLLDALEAKLLSALSELLDDREGDAATLKRSADIIAAARNFNLPSGIDIPDSLKGPEIPEPPKR